MEKLKSRQKEIITTATRLISERGIQNMTTKNLAEAVGISEPALYRHFKNKKDILSTILIDYKENCRQIIEDIDQPEYSKFEALKLLFIARCIDFNSNPYITSIIFSDEMFKFEPDLANKVDDIMSLHEAFIRNAISGATEQNEIRDDIPRGHIVLIIMGALRLLVRNWKINNCDFDLIDRAYSVWNSIEILIKKEK